MDDGVSLRTSLELWTTSPSALRLGSALLHFVWQGAVLAAGIGSLLLCLRHTRGQVRYLVQLVGLGLMAACPIVTWSLIPVDVAPAGSAAAPGATSVVNSDPGSIEPGFAAVRDAGLIEKVAATPSLLVGPELDPPVRDVSAVERPDRIVRWRQVAAAVAAVRPWCVVAWLGGVCLFSLRILAGLLGLEWTRRQGSAPVDDAVATMLRQLAQRMGIRRAVHVFRSTTAEIPTLVGWLRPVILLPATALTGLSPSQLQAVLAHELAHVQRHDALVNLLQLIVETLLFYHPAVWWLSRRIRAEREHCCDDIAVAMCGDRIGYARALATLEELRPAPRWAVAASGGSLVTRIRRMVGRPEPVKARPGAIAIVAVSLLLVVCLGVLQRAEAVDPGELPTDRPVVVAPEGRDAEVPEKKPAAIATAPAVDPELEATAKLVDEALARISRLRLTAGIHTPRQIMESIAGLGLEQVFWSDQSRRSEISARDWLASGAKLREQPVWIITPAGGKAHEFTRPFEFESFPQQFLAYLAAADAPLDLKIGAYDADGTVAQTVTVHDLVNDAQQSLNSKNTMIWSTWSLAHYVSTDETWKTADGEEWSVARMLQQLRPEPIDDVSSPFFALSRQEYMAVAVALRKYAAEHPGTMPTEWPTPWRTAHASLRDCIGRSRGPATERILFLPELRPMEKIEPAEFYRLEEAWTQVALELRWLLTFLPEERQQGGWMEHAIEQLARYQLSVQKQPRTVHEVYAAADALRLYRERLAMLSRPVAKSGPAESTARPVSVSGRVVDAAGKSVAGARLWWLVGYRTAAFEEILVEGTSDQNGDFQLRAPDDIDLAHLEAETHGLWALANGYNLTAVDMLNANGGLEVTPQRITLQAAAETTFVVVGPDDGPLPHISVAPCRLTKDRTDLPAGLRDVLARKTDATGRIRLPYVEPASLVSVRVNAPGLGEQCVTLAGRWLESPNDTIKLRAAGSIRGRLTGAGREWIREATLTVYSESSEYDFVPIRVANKNSPVTGPVDAPVGAAVVTTDSEGRFEIPDLAAGSLRVQILTKGSDAMLPRLPKHMDVVANQTTDLDIAFEPSVLVEGVVVCEDRGISTEGSSVRIAFDGNRQHVWVAVGPDSRYSARALAGPVATYCRVTEDLRGRFEDAAQDRPTRDAAKGESPTQLPTIVLRARK